MRSAPMELDQTSAAILACVVGLTVGAWLALAYRRLRDSWRARAHNLRGKRAESAAAKLLVSRGYRVLAQQDRRKYLVKQDDAEQPVELIIDFVVERNGERFAAEVKTAGAAVGIERADTRRQLLEYQLALGCKRVLLVDPEHDAITTLEFPIPRPASATTAAPKPRAASLTTAVVSLVVVVVVVIVLVTMRR